MVSGKISVIIPAYNRGKYIHQTVCSVFDQTYTNFEIIVVDDGSTDNTHEVLVSFGNRIALYEHDGRQNRGQSASINLGLEKANGDYIAILDSDDFWEPEKLELQAGFLNDHPDVGLVYCNGTAVNSNGEFLYDIYPPGHYEKNIPGSILLDCYIHLPSNSLVRKSVFDRAGNFDESMRAAQDHDMLVRIAEITRLGYINQSVYHYRRHQQSISKSSKGASMRWKNGFIILDRAMRRFPYTSSIIRKRKAVLHFRLFQCALENKDFFKAMMELVLSGLHDPARAYSVLMRHEKISSQH